MNFKKKVSGSWVDAPYYLKSTDTETITTLPATIYPLAQTATIGLKGHTVQNGTPTPENPVPVVGVGDLDNGNYKIPILSANTTTPVYLGEVQSTRQIKKLVLTGKETWYSSGTYTGAVYAYHSQFPGIKPLTPIFCTHLVDTHDSQYVQGTCKNDLNSVGMWVFDTVTSPTAFKAYLAQQYAAGTPVTVWYVLAEPTTGIVNEPLQKIGDYADSISGISIPTITGANTLDVDTTVKPSEISAAFNGWHPVTSAHERENGAWT